MPKRRVARRDVEQPLDSSYRLISLTHDQVAIVDAADYLWLAEFNWFAAWNRRTSSWYARRCTPKDENGRQYTVQMHREILGLGKGDPRQGDHRNPGMTLDNRRSNLRIATAAQQRNNQTLRSSNTSGFRGVVAYGEMWRAQIEIKGKSVTILVDSDKERVARAYDEAAVAAFGEFAQLNFPLIHSPE